MLLPDLERLKAADPQEWDRAFDWLWPTIVVVVGSKLGLSFASEAEDVAIDAMECLVDHVPDVSSIDELKLLGVAIARNKAVDFLRRQLSIKRGSGRVESLDKRADLDSQVTPIARAEGMVDIDTRELAQMLQDLLKKIGDAERAILTDFYVVGLTYVEISQK